MFRHLPQNLAVLSSYAKSSTKTFSNSRTICCSALHETVKPSHTSQGKCHPEMSGPTSAHAVSSGSAVPANHSKDTPTRCSRRPNAAQENAANGSAACCGISQPKIAASHKPKVTLGSRAFTPAAGKRGSPANPLKYPAVIAPKPKAS